MAAALLKKVRASRKQVGVLSVTPSSLEGTSRTVIAAVDTACSNDPGPSNISTMVKGKVHHGATKSVAAIATSNIKTNQAKAFRNVMMLFFITIVFIACWVPIWLMQMGVYISEGSETINDSKLCCQPFHLRRRQCTVPGRRATVLPPDTNQTVRLLPLNIDKQILEEVRR